LEKKMNNRFLPVAQELEQLRIKKYPVGGYFKEHIDAADRSSSRRYLSAFVYLNESGGTKFFDKKIKAQPGTMVIFPPQWMFPHTGLVGDKPKYFLSTYLHFSA
jgi:prolyl 4-hydroxylase